ncbi:fructose-specific PTS transporter subunit EIIC [Mycoplasmopsis cynos]|uniref:PTS fructose transporter subunit IIABC n=1 Tax=Mycoplasmopsis cynos TaxID=171284 RepID=UPI002B0001C4|nr:fructose-specific PTS transporter subunit EIIC [Mycoplasmopsis cynos]WQQ13002.1 fructose-specific PTS transporter subunit EIIC [Mycoplasmopsis cynos]WQQ14104.1 fructose-specific PTS transporter subunit EIIC [Mycoplasmopsis cynos]WQQ18497.1 fructose-specific PTS transporter subunit EIIC [Mycoplasmopsis cynos]
MQLRDLFHEDLIFLNKKSRTKKGVLKFFSDELFKKGYANSSSKVLNLFLNREEQGSTGIGDKIAMPHLGDDAILKSTLIFAKVDNLDWNSVDNQPVSFIFGIALSKDKRQAGHIEIIQKLSTLLINPSFVTELNNVTSKDEFLNVIKKYETIEDQKNEQVVKELTNQNHYDIVAVTACPTGIAHTFLAKEKLIEEAKKMNISIKVETQGTEGIQNKLTHEDILNAKGVLLATDREIEKDKFADATNVLEISTQKAIHDARTQIQALLDNKGKRLKIAKGQSSSSDGEMTFDGFAGKMRRSLMSGISHMLPFIVFGGILIALGFLIDIIIASSSGVDINSKNFLSTFGFGHPVAKIVFDLGKVGLSFAVPILAAYIAFSLVGRQGLLPGFVVGAISSGTLSGSYGFLKNAIASSGVADPDKFLGTGSGFIGGIFGAFFAAAMVIVFSKYIFGKLPKSLQGIKNILFIPLFGTLTIAVLFWIVNIALIFINLGLVLFLQIFENRRELAWILGLILGAMMAIDLGGPINKAAYIFGTLTIANGHSTISMAAVMASGMVPPLGISLSMFINKKLWTNEELESGKYSNILFGLSFISEGAIPYTGRNPKVLVPSNIIGGAVAGIVSAALGVNIIAPHGGIFVSFLARTDLFNDFALSAGLGIVFWILAIIIGAITQAGAIILFSHLNKKYPNWTKIFIKKKRA